MAPRRDTKWWGWGDPAIVAASSTREALACCASGSASWSPGRWRAELEDFELPRGASRCRRR